jgi:predicted nuclease with RNAse H fold
MQQNRPKFRRISRKSTEIDEYYLDVNAIELVETSPRAARSETLEEFSHGNEVETIRAIEDYALHRQGLGQIFGRFLLIKCEAI